MADAETSTSRSPSPPTPLPPLGPLPALASPFSALSLLLSAPRPRPPPPGADVLALLPRPLPAHQHRPRRREKVPLDTDRQAGPTRGVGAPRQGDFRTRFCVRLKSPDSARDSSRPSWCGVQVGLTAPPIRSPHAGVHQESKLGEKGGGILLHTHSFGIPQPRQRPELSPSYCCGMKPKVADRKSVV